MKASLLFPVLAPLLALAACSSSSESADDQEEPSDEGALTVQDIAARGELQMHFPVAGRPDELCIIPKKGGGAYSKSDLDDEKKLCNVNFESASPGEPAALCPKTSSTNPGIYVNKLDGQDKAAVEAAGCKTSKIGAFKQSVTCSYTGAIIGYYHLSRLLGGVANVPVAVGRTMDLEKHKAMVERGIAAAKSVDGPGFDVYDGWVQYKGWDANPKAAPRSAQVYTTDLMQIYGAFQDNAKDNGRHPLLRTGGGPAGMNQFLAGTAFKAISESTPLAQRFPGAGADPQSLQGLVLAKDASDMVIMDELMSQQDRYGNIESQAFKMFEEGGALKKVRLDRKDDSAESPVDRPDVQGVIVHELLLRDNDCGVAKTNVNASANGGKGIVGSLAHMSAHTYKHFQWVAAELAKTGSAVQNTFVQEAFFNATDLANVSKQAVKLAATLKQRCDGGALALDADLRDQRAGRIPGREACALAEPPPAPALGSEGGVIDSHGIEQVSRKTAQ
jgi:hypothetical protein